MHLLIIMQSKLVLQSAASSPAVYRYFSARARAREARNLSMDTWTSGVKSLGNMMAMTTSMLWERICEKKTITQMLHGVFSILAFKFKAQVWKPLKFEEDFI